MPTTGRLVRTAAALAATGALVAGLASPVLAAPTPGGSQPGNGAASVLDNIKTEGAAAIAQRQAQLTKLGTRLASAPSCDTNGAISGVIAADGPALDSLGTKLAADTTLADARDDFQAIFYHYRIYLVVTPQAYVTSACGRITQAAATLSTDHDKLETRVQAAAAGGADMTAAEQSLADMSVKVTDATAKAQDANSTLAAITPDNGDKAMLATNAAAVQNARTALITAHADLKAAVSDAHAVIDALKAAAHH